MEYVATRYAYSLGSLARLAMGAAVAVLLGAAASSVLGRYEVLYAIVQSWLLFLVVGLWLIPATARRISIPRGYLWLSYAAHLGGSLAMGLWVRLLRAGDSYDAYHPLGVAIKEGLVRPSDFLTLTGLHVVGIIAGMWYSVLGVSFWGMYLLSGTIAFGAMCLIAADMDSVYPRTESHGRVVLALLFLPSFLLWHGLFGKEPWVVLGTVLTLHGVILMHRGRGLAGWATFLGGVLLTGFLRPHFAAFEVVAFGAALLFARRGSRGAFLIPALALVIVARLALPSLVSSVGVEALSLETVTARLAGQNENLQLGGSATGLAVGRTIGVGGFIRALPVSILAVLAMPYPGQYLDPVRFLASAETALVLLALLRFAPRALAGALTKRDLPLLYAWFYCGVFLLVMSVPLSANVGLMIRQRAIMWPLLLFATLAGPRRAAPSVAESRRRAAVPAPAQRPSEA